MERLGYIVILGLCVWACSASDEHTSAAPPGHVQPDPARVTPAAGRDRTGSGCLVDEGGCRTSPMAVPECTAEAAKISAFTLDQLLDAPDPHVDRVIALRGPLVRSGARCTELECERTCCNTCTSIIAIGDMAADEHVRLESVTAPGHYVCRGDESLVCCAVEARGQEVIAQGTLQQTPGVDLPEYQLWTTELCAIPTSDDA